MSLQIWACLLTPPNIVLHLPQTKATYEQLLKKHITSCKISEHAHVHNLRFLLQLISTGDHSQKAFKH